MGAKSIVLIAGFAVATLLYLVYLGATYEPPEGTTTVVVPPPVPRPVEQAEPQSPAPPPAQPDPAPAPGLDAAPGEQAAQAPQVAEVDETPAEQEPAPQTEAVESEPLEAEPEDLPSLNNSDSFLAARLQQLDNGVALLSHLADEQLVRRFVVLVDNVAQGNIPQANLPYNPVPGEFPVRVIDDNLFEMAEAGFRRFDAAVEALVAIDAGQLVALYRLASPLFQQAYAELGYGEASFDLALQRAIRRVLSTDDVSGTPQLVKPSVMYLYADSQLEARSDIQKQMIRIGPVNRDRVKAKLREFLQAL